MRGIRTCRAMDRVGRATLQKLGLFSAFLPPAPLERSPTHPARGPRGWRGRISVVMPPLVCLIRFQYGPQPRRLHALIATAAPKLSNTCSTWPAQTERTPSKWWPLPVHNIHEALANTPSVPKHLTVISKFYVPKYLTVFSQPKYLHRTCTRAQPRWQLSIPVQC